MKTSKFLKTAIFTGLILIFQGFTTPGRFDDINVDSSPIEVGESISVDQEEAQNDDLKTSIQKVIETQKHFLDHWGSQKMDKNAKILRYKIGAAMVGFQVAELMDKVNARLGEEAFRPYTPVVEEINSQLRTVVKQQKEIDSFEAELKLKHEKKFYKNKLLFEIPIN